MIELEQVTKKYIGDTYDVTVLDCVDLKINDGEFVAIMGKSGSGKTTLLNLIGCMDDITEGKIIIDGVDISNMNSYRLDKVRKNKISFIFQNYALMQQYTVFENVELPLNARNVKSKEKNKIVKEVMEKLGIYELKDKYPRQISGGEQQRTAIARAMAAGSKYILADEPTGALDEVNSVELMKIFDVLHKEGKTIIMVTHDEEMASYADRKILLEKGKIY